MLTILYFKTPKKTHDVPSRTMYNYMYNAFDG